MIAMPLDISESLIIIYRIDANTTILLIRAAHDNFLNQCPLPGQILDYNGQIWLKFECNGTKKSWTKIRTATFH